MLPVSVGRGHVGEHVSGRSGSSRVGLCRTCCVASVSICVTGTLFITNFTLELAFRSIDPLWSGSATTLFHHAFSRAVVDGSSAATRLTSHTVVRLLTAVVVARDHSQRQNLSHRQEEAFHPLFPITVVSPS